MKEAAYFEINRFYPDHPNLPVRCEVGIYHYWKEDIAMSVFNQFCSKQKRKDGCMIQWITEHECVINKIIYKLELMK